MKVLTIMGSPRKNGKTATALKLFEENMQSQGHEVERVNIIDYKINGCLGCFACFSKTNEPGCVQKDDAQAVFEKMFSADAIIYASPLYSFDFTAQLKPLIDRHFCLIKTPLLEGKRTALLITCAGQTEGNADLVQEAFRRSFDKTKGVLHTDLVGEYVIPFSDAPDFSERAKAMADTMAAEISADS